MWNTSSTPTLAFACMGEACLSNLKTALLVTLFHFTVAIVQFRARRAIESVDMRLIITTCYLLYTCILTI